MYTCTLSPQCHTDLLLQSLDLLLASPPHILQFSVQPLALPYLLFKQAVEPGNLLDLWKSSVHGAQARHQALPRHLQPLAILSDVVLSAGVIFLPLRI